MEILGNIDILVSVFFLMIPGKMCTEPKCCLAG